MSNEILATGTPSGSMCCIIIREDGLIFDNDDGDYPSTPPTAADASIALTELGSTGRFRADVPAGAMSYATGQKLKVECFAVAEGSLAYTTAVSSTQTLLVNNAGTAIVSDALAGQPRINLAPPEAATVEVSSRADGEHVCVRPIRIRAGSVGSRIVAIDMAPLFGERLVQSVGTPTVTPTGAITATAEGPRDTLAVLTLTGTATAGATYVVTVPITMDNGEIVDVDLEIEVFSD